MAPTNVSDFATAQLGLLDRELDAELAETADLASQTSPAALQRLGLAVLNLQVGSQRTGLGGKTVLELERDAAFGGVQLPENGIRTGDIVGIREQIGGATKKKEKAEVETQGLDGVVVKTTENVIAVALDRDVVDVPGGRLWIIKLANDVTYKRMNQTMKRLKNLSESSTSPFIRVLFGHSSPAPVPSDLKALDQTVGEISWNSESLNDSQKDAVRFALASKEIALIHGPPGTGKTHTLIELILQLLKKGSHILVCGPSNISVDNIVERLAPYKVPMVRLGHPARLLPSVLDHSLEVLTKTSEAAALVRDIRKEMDDKQASIRKTRSGKERREVYGEIKELRRDYRERERGCVDSLVQGSKVVLSTLHGAGSFQLRQTQFDVVIIDEASQALEAQCWVALLSAKKAVLAGDHLQLPPTIKSLNSKAHTSSAENKKSSASEGLQPSKDGEGKPRITKEDGEGKRLDKQIPGSLEVTLFDRLLTLHGPSIKRMLTTQYRMHSSIMSFPSSALYEDKLIAAPSVSARLLCQLKYNTPVQETEDTTVPLVFYDTQGGDFPEKSEDVLEQGNQKRKVKSTSSLGESKSNELEAALVSRHVGNLVEAGICADEIAVIAPYNAQVALIGTMLKEKFASIELGSVDGFQGREKEAVVVSLVRSNAEREVGFLSERRRLNVAMTRPRRHLCVIGDSETVGR